MKSNRGKRINLKNIKINLFKYRELFYILLVAFIIILIPVVFGVISNNKYKSISKSPSSNKMKVERENLSGGEQLVNLNIDFRKVKVFNENTNRVEIVELEDYIKGVVSSEMPMAFAEEALVAQGVLARTFVVNKIINPCTKAKKYSAHICNTTHCQVYRPHEKNISSIGHDKNEFMKKLNGAVDKTKDKVLAYDDIMIRYPQYFAISSGKTENGIDVFNMDVPYLKSVTSKGEEESPKYKSEEVYTISKFINTVNETYRSSGLTSSNIKKSVEILSRNEGGTVKEIKLNKVTIKGTDFRKLFRLNSANFDIRINNQKVIINCLGYGHGVGMSQWGANAMAKKGKKYEEILTHYFSGTNIISLEEARLEV